MANERETITLKRDCEVVEIPAGTKAVLNGGQDVVLMQSLGGNYTVYSHTGAMYRIDSKDADALGFQQKISDLQANILEKVNQGATLNQTEVEALIWDQLKSCFDPEIPVNIVDLGLIYLCEVNPLASEGYRVDVRMTLTAPGCGMGGVLKSDVEGKLSSVPGVKEVYVELVFDPQWDQSRMTEAAMLQLNLL